MASVENLPIEPARGITPIGMAPYTMRIDERDRILRVEARGFWTLAQTEDFLAEFAELVGTCRRRYGRVRAIVDRRDCPRDAPTVLDRLKQADASMLTDSDRIAVVVGSSLMKAQARLHLRHQSARAFLSYPAAELWLSAWS